SFPGLVDVYLVVVTPVKKPHFLSITGMNTWKEGILPYAKGIRLTDDCMCAALHKHLMCYHYGTYTVHLVVMKSGESPLRSAPLGYAVTTVTLN
ncbi:MAG: hypothetical protein NT045_03010, partial [Candidatus Aureabacteria bacterium]|nr:hypothetical protein [Candidatus Auribacterota bacterium]